jgi:hypothetical protein
MSDKKIIPGKVRDGIQKGNFKPDAPSNIRPIQPPPPPTPTNPKK